MLRGYKILTITHRQVPLKTLANYVIPTTVDVPARLAQLKEQFGLTELMYLATCNRAFYFIYDHDLVANPDFCTRFFQHINPNLSNLEIKQIVSVYIGDDAIRHLYEVSASIDSLVVGEREILRQLREAYDDCNKLGLTGHYLRLAMRLAVEMAKEIYTDTQIGTKPVSVVSLAMDKFQRQHLSKDARIVLIGAGQTNILVTKFLVKYGYTNICIFNRSLQRAKDLARSCQAKAYSLEELARYEGGFDCLIVCTGNTEAFVQSELYQQLLQGELQKKVVIDLAIPHNVDKNIVKNFNVKYIDIERLKELAQQNLSFREQEVAKAKLLINNRLLEFRTAFQHRQIELAMKDMTVEIKAVKEKVVNEVFKKDLAKLDDDTRILLNRMLTYMEKKCISIPMKAAKSMVE